MATKNTRSKKSGSKTKLAPNSLSAWAHRIGKQNAIIIAVFILAFGGIGGWTLRNSFAATSCVANTYRQGSYGHCVSDIQFMLVNAHYAGKDCYGDSLSGIQPQDQSFGPKTAHHVYCFQIYYGNLIGNSVVNAGTWRGLCHTSYSTGHYGVWADVGCSAKSWF